MEPGNREDSAVRSDLGTDSCQRPVLEPGGVITSITERRKAPYGKRSG